MKIVDASTDHSRAVLARGDHGKEHPVLYLGRNPHDTMYSTVKNEALAIKWALEKLQYYLCR